MYLKRDRKTLSSGPVTYVSLAHNVWEGHGREEGQARPVVLMNLGLESELDPDYAETLLVASQAVFDRRVSQGDSVATALDAVRKVLAHFRAPLKILGSRDLGMRLVLEPIWERLGVKAALREYESRHRITFPLERIVFAMVLNRLVDPVSKRACNEWLSDVAYFPEAEDWQVQHFYRAMDLLHEHWPEIEAVVYRHLWEQTPEDLRGVWLVDTTSMYFESTRSDEELAELLADHEDAILNEVKPPSAPMPAVVNEPAFRMRGHNKDGHSGDPQVVIASVVSPQGQVLRHKTYAGNTNDYTITRDLLATLDKPDGTAALWVADGGMIAKDHAAMLDSAGWLRLHAGSLRKSALAQELLLSGPGRYKRHSKKPKLSFREVLLPPEQSPSGRSEKWFVARNAIDRERQLKKLAEHREKVVEALARQGEEGPHGKSICKIASHPTLGKYVKRSERVEGQFVINEDAFRKEELLAGTRLYQTTMTDWTAEELHDAYQLLQEVEANHRELKTPMRLRPCYHRVTERIQAHVMLNILALNCIRMLEAQTGKRAAEIRKLTKQVKAVQMSQGGTPYWQPTEMSKDYLKLLKTLKVQAPPASWTVWREGRPETESLELEVAT